MGIIWASNPLRVDNRGLWVHFYQLILLYLTRTSTITVHLMLYTSHHLPLTDTTQMDRLTFCS